MIPRFSLHKLKNAIEKQRAEVKLSNRRYAVAQRFKEAEKRKDKKEKPNRSEARLELQYLYYNQDADAVDYVGNPFSFRPSQESIVTAVRDRGNPFWKKNAEEIEKCDLIESIISQSIHQGYPAEIRLGQDCKPPEGYSYDDIYIMYSWDLPLKVIRLKMTDEEGKEIDADSFYYESRGDMLTAVNNISIGGFMSKENAERLDMVIFQGIVNGWYDEDLDTIDAEVYDDNDKLLFYAITPMIAS